MRDYLEAIRRCLLRPDQGEARRLMGHAYRHALPTLLRRPLADVALGRRAAPPASVLRQLEALQDLTLDDSDGPPTLDSPQLELPLQPAPWSRPVSLTVARAARWAGARHEPPAARSA